MKICGNICVGRNYEEFVLKCFHCSSRVEIAEWQEFVLHIRNLHSSIGGYSESELISESDAITDYTKKYSVYHEIELKTENEEYINENEQIEYSISQEYGQLQNEKQIEENDLLFIEPIGVPNSGVYNSHSETEAVEDDGNEAHAATLEPTVKFDISFFRRNPCADHFIQLYKALPCLWDTNHAQYHDKDAHDDAYRSLMREMQIGVNVSLTERKLRYVIKKLHSQYAAIEKRITAGNQKINAVVLQNYENCSFLSKSIVKENNKVQLDIEQVFQCDAEKIKLDLSGKNSATTSFIDLYFRFPELYDPSHKDFSNIKVRKEAYEAMSSELSFRNVCVTTDDVLRSIQYLRQWYYRTMKRVNIPLMDHFYLDKCSFLPPKMFKQRLYCEICQNQFFSDHTLQAHMFKNHKIGELPFKCTICERSFDSRTELIIHKQRAHIGKVHKCSYCERSFAVYADLRLHMRTHTGNKPYVCEHCGKSFRVKTQLGYHVTAIHTKIRAFKCTMCPKDFLKNRDLQDHIKAHLNIRDKICETCGKGFTNCHSLIRHRQIHAEVKKFVCKLCNSRFSQFVGLNSHMKRSHNIIRNITKEPESTTMYTSKEF